MRQSSETGRHLLSDPGTPLSPNIQGELLFFPSQGTTQRHKHETVIQFQKLVTVTLETRNKWSITTHTWPWCLNIPNLKQMCTHHTNRNLNFHHLGRHNCTHTFQWKMNTRANLHTTRQNTTRVLCVCLGKRYEVQLTLHTQTHASSHLTFNSAEFTECQFPLFSLISQQSFLLLWWQAGFWETENVCVCLCVCVHTCLLSCVCVFFSLYMTYWHKQTVLYSYTVNVNVKQVYNPFYFLNVTQFSENDI